MAYPGARILLLDTEGFRAVRYEETAHYAVTREFLTDPAHMLKQLLDDDKETRRARPRR